jgi:hypothetical protein
MAIVSRFATLAPAKIAVALKVGAKVQRAVSGVVKESHAITLLLSRLAPVSAESRHEAK